MIDTDRPRPIGRPTSTRGAWARVGGGGVRVARARVGAALRGIVCCVVVRLSERDGSLSSSGSPYTRVAPFVAPLYHPCHRGLPDLDRSILHGRTVATKLSSTSTLKINGADSGCGFGYHGAYSRVRYFCMRFCSHALRSTPFHVRVSTIVGSTSCSIKQTSET